MTPPTKKSKQLANKCQKTMYMVHVCLVRLPYWFAVDPSKPCKGELNRDSFHGSGGLFLYQPPCTYQFSVRRQSGEPKGPNIGALLIIRTGFWGPLYYKYNKEPPK